LKKIPIGKRYFLPLHRKMAQIVAGHVPMAILLDRDQKAPRHPRDKIPKTGPRIKIN